MRRLVCAPAIKKLRVSELCVVTGRIDGGDGALPPRISVIEVERDSAVDGPVGADVRHRSKRAVPVGRAPGEAEDLIVEGSAALVPEILAGGQLKPMQVAAQ